MDLAGGVGVEGENTVNERVCIGYIDIDKETIFEVGKFSVLWNVFESDCCDCHCSASKIIDMENAIENLGKEPFKRLAKEFIERAGRLGDSTEEYVSKRIYPQAGAKITPENKKAHMPLVVKFIESEGEDNLTGAMLAIFRIRNNMFHGLKGCSELDDQIELFRVMSAVLEVVIQR